MVLSRGYSVREVERALGVPRALVLSFVKAGFITPTRGTRREYRFSFQDLIVIKTAQDLGRAEVPARRMASALKQLRARLPEQQPLAGLRIAATGASVIVRQGEHQWQADSGQYLLDLGSANATAAGGARKRAAARWFEHANQLEEQAPKRAIEAYSQAIAQDRRFAAAHINLGRLLHASGRHVEAEKTYRNALKCGGREPVLRFNLGVLLQDVGRGAEAIVEYEAALALDPNLADCHYNLALLFEANGKSQSALRHLQAYRKLQG